MSLPSPREAAYLAVLSYLKTGAYADETLASLAMTDVAQARHIAYGTIQRLLSLDFIARQLAKRTSLSLKPKEKALLFTALYQAHFQQGAPLYAIANETLKLAKKVCHSTFLSFLNAILRAYGTQRPALPAGDSPHDLSIHFSYPQWFVEQLLKERGLETTKTILALGNQPAPTMARVRESSNPFNLVTVADPSTISASTQHYIQNATPVHLIQHLAKTVDSPARVLDLCAAPGGKLILAHDIFPKALLFANDVSEKRLAVLRQNMEKYGIFAELTCGPAESYCSPHRFDLIILDVPCSNTGVLGKRPEARWRLSQTFLDDMTAMQRRLVTAAMKLLAPGGVLWYLTCSILKSENEDLIESPFLDSMTQLPNADGWDGGFAGWLEIDQKLFKG